MKVIVNALHKGKSEAGVGVLEFFKDDVIVHTETFSGFIDDTLNPYERNVELTTDEYTLVESGASADTTFEWSLQQ